MDLQVGIICGITFTAWVVRSLYDASGAKHDLIYVTTIVTIRCYKSLYEWLHGLPLRAVVIFMLSLIAVLLISSFVTLVIASLSRYREKSFKSPSEAAGPELDMRPLIFPAQTSHTRIVPKKHSFSYSYLLVGIPVGWQGSIESLLSADVESRTHSGSNDSHGGSINRAWYSVEASDHLDRGNGYLGLQGKLHSYLVSQGESPTSYPYAYLVTAPRFLGYSFNPVSFWYLYSAQKELTAMILEVNNTFDERRLYFLKANNEVEEQDSSPSATVDKPISKPIKDTDEVLRLVETEQGKLVFTNSWSKDFHVSPFNSRKGSYKLTAHDPFFPYMSGKGNVHNTIVLTSSKEHAKLVARVFSTQESIDPATMTVWATLKFLLVWSWVGFNTFPRIVREAGKLFFRKKLHVWFRPEVLKDSIGRMETKRERIIEDCFRKYLRSRVEQVNLDYTVKYIASGTHNLKEEIFYPTDKLYLPVLPGMGSGYGCLEFKVLTPLFYSRLIRFSHISEFISSEILEQDDTNRTFWTSDPTKLLEIFTEKHEWPLPDIDSRKVGWVEQTRWTILKKLRKSPQKFTPTVTLNDRHVSDIREFPLSSMDRYVMHLCDEEHTKGYRRAVTTLLISDHLTFGVVEVLDAAHWLIRLTLCYLSVLAGGRVFLNSFQGRPPMEALFFTREILLFNGMHLWLIFENTTLQ